MAQPVDWATKGEEKTNSWYTRPYGSSGGEVYPGRFSRLGFWSKRKRGRRSVASKPTAGKEFVSRPSFHCLWADLLGSLGARSLGYYI